MTHASPPLILVTGSTDGIGKETARQLLARGARVLLHGRDAGRARAARAELAKWGQGDDALPDPVLADLASLTEVRALASKVLDVVGGTGSLVLINNAGIFQRARVLSADGFELTQAVNHLAPFLLTMRLHEALGERLTRVVNVSSGAHQRGTVEVDDVGLVRRKFDSYGHYSASKLANVLFTMELARRAGDRPPRVNALHPGVVSTKLLTEGFGFQGSDSLEDSARTSVMLALDAVGATRSGGYFSDEHEATPSRTARDADLARAFFEASARAVGIG